MEYAVKRHTLLSKSFCVLHRSRNNMGPEWRENSYNRHFKFSYNSCMILVSLFVFVFVFLFCFFHYL